MCRRPVSLGFARGDEARGDSVSRVLNVLRFKRRDSAIHVLDPRSKFMLLVALSVASLILADPVTLLALLAVEAIILKAAKCLRDWLASLRGLLLMLAVIFALNYLTLPSHRLFTSLAMTVRFLDLATAFSIFFLTTTPDELATALEASGVPRDYTLMFTMSLRFVPTLARDLQTVADALKSRGLELEKGGLRERLRNYVYLLVPLIIYELRRSLMVAEALEARGFGAVRRVEPYYELKLKERDYAVIALSWAFIAALAYLSLSGCYGALLAEMLAYWP